MNDEKSPEQPDLLELPGGEKEQKDEVKKQELQNSFKRVHERSDKFSHEWDLKREAKDLDMEVEEYRRWYELSSKPPTWRSRFWHWTGFGEKKFWDILQLTASIAVPVVLGVATYSLQKTSNDREQAVNDREQAAAVDKANQDTLVKYLDQMAELLQKGLRKTKTGSEMFIIAQAKTVIALQSLDPKRQHLVIQFLNAANLNTLPGEKGILYKARMSKANLNKADLSGAKISKAELSGANIQWANLSGADLIEAKLTRGKLSEANLQGARLYGADISFADLSGANLSGANLNGADLNMTKLIGASLVGADLIGAKLSGADLIDADLLFANLSGADLSEAKLIGAQLGAKLSDADLTGADLRGADLRGADLSGTKTLIQAKFCKTTLPDGMVSNRDCGK